MVVNNIFDAFNIAVKNPVDTAQIKSPGATLNSQRSAFDQQLVSTDDKQKFVSEQPGEVFHSPLFYLRFQSNVPIAHTPQTTKSHFEPKRDIAISRKDKEDTKQEPVNNVSKDEAISSDEGQGFYLVVNEENSPDDSYQKRRSAADIMRERLQLTYGLIKQNQVGSLVNLAF